MSAQDQQELIKVLMVCLGNICRSPTAHGVFQQRIDHHKLNNRLLVDSAGTGSWHIGSPPDERATEAAMRRGYDLTDLRARQIRASDYHEFDYILAMDYDNLRSLQSRCPDIYDEKLDLFLAYSEREDKVVPDPYYSGADGFELVLDMVEDASDRLIAQLISRHFS